MREWLLFGKARGGPKKRTRNRWPSLKVANEKRTRMKLNYVNVEIFSIRNLGDD